MEIMTAPREKTVCIADPYTELKQAMDSLKAEHTLIQKELKHFYDEAKALESMGEAADLRESLRKFAGKAAVLMGQLTDHSKWEEVELFPLVELYGGQEARSLEVLEKEHSLAYKYMGSFFTELEASEGPIDLAQARELLSNWLQAYFILNEHLNKEEQVIIPYVEQMLTDIEQFYS